MSNPIDDLLFEMEPVAAPEEKTATSFFGQTIDAAKGGVGMGLAAAGVTGAALGVQQLYNAATKSRDFRTMLEHNQDLAGHEDQKSVSMAFTSLRRFAPEFSKDPLVAGTYVRRIVENPMGAGGVIGEALGHNRNPHPMMEQGLAGMQGGLKYKDPKDFMRKDLEHQKAVQESQHGYAKQLADHQHGLRSKARPPREE
jgi:hypothetical protein